MEGRLYFASAFEAFPRSLRFSSSYRLIFRLHEVFILDLYIQGERYCFPKSMDLMEIRG